MALVLVVLIIGFLILLPLANILVYSTQPSGSAILTNSWSDIVTRDIIWNTIKLGLSVAFLGTLLGFIMAYTQARVEFRGKKILHIINLIPIISPPFAFATAVIVLFGRSGIITRGVFDWRPTLYGFPGLVLVLTLSFFPIAYMNLLGMLRSLDPALDEAGSSLGASKWKVFKTVTLPLLIPGFAGSFLLLFIEAIADLANPIIIGGNYTVLASRAYMAINGDYDISLAAGYSTLLLLPALLVFLIQRYWAQKRSVVSVTGKPSGRPTMVTSKPAKFFLLSITGLLTSLVILVYLTVVFGAFVKIIGVNNEFTLDNFRYLLGGFANGAIKTTATLALIATPIAGIFGMVIAWLVIRKVRRGAEALDFLGMLGIAVPGTVIGIGYAITYNDPVKIGDFTVFPQVGGGGAILGGAIAIVMVYIIRSSPAGQRSGIAQLQQIDPAIEEASASLGASGGKTFRLVTLPLISGAFLSGLMYAFAHSMTTLSPIIFLVTPDTSILTQKILAEADQGRYGNVFALCCILIVLIMIIGGLINLFVRKTQVSVDRPMVTGR
ncbi:MAG: iron ABC transporter permease [Candidatus Nanopelagicaceae bacterium]|nr:iron ABC transporter permease [Candidatus Nanopelagicaceae bacterium]